MDEPQTTIMNEPEYKRSVVKTDLPIPPGFPVKVETVLASLWIFLSKLDPTMKRKVAPILEYMIRKLNQ